MDEIRHTLALFALVFYPPALGFWFLVHPFIRMWRRAGLVTTYGVVTCALIALAVAVFLNRGSLLGRDFGTNWWLIAAGSGWLAWLTWLGFTNAFPAHHLGTATRLGVPELKAIAGPNVFVSDGVYAYVRHPIYGSGSLAGLGFAFVVNYAGIYALALAAFPILFLVTVIEERELAERFGDAYRRYQMEVPRLVPRLPNKHRRG